MNNMSHSMTEPKEVIIMLLIMFISGLLSTMNIWVDKISDIRFHLNDVYMALLMCGWMLVIMGIYYINASILMIGIVFTIITIICIRKQIFIDETQYLKGMIPHHSMAVLMSKRLLEKEKKNNNIQNNLISNVNKFAQNIIKTQNDEIKFMNFALYSKNNI